MKVYVVIEITSMNSFTDLYGQTANDYEEIIGIYDSKIKAQQRKEKCESELIETDDDDDSDVYYQIREYELNK